MTLRQFMCGPGKRKPRRGSITRVAERLGVSAGTVLRWITGERAPGVETAIKIQDLIHSKEDIFAAKQKNLPVVERR